MLQLLAATAAFIQLLFLSHYHPSFSLNYTQPLQLVVNQVESKLLPSWRHAAKQPVVVAVSIFPSLFPDSYPPNADSFRKLDGAIRPIPTR